MTFKVHQQHPPTATVSIQSDAKSKERFPQMSNDDFDKMVENGKAAGTKKIADWSVRQFQVWLEERDIPVEFEMLPAEELDLILRKFYAETRKVDGEMYGRSSYNGIRAAMNRQIRDPPFNRNISLTNDKEFHKSNQFFNASLRKLSAEGLDITTHHESISDGDLKKLRCSSSFHNTESRALEKKVWFELTLAFARRGCENIQKLKKDAYIIKTDDSGREYVEMVYNEKLKNHQGVQNTVNRESKPRMYGSKSIENCPVNTLKLYLSKLNPENELLFQQAKKPNTFPKIDDVSFTTRGVGEKTIASFMASLSKEAGLSRRYTNHCVRATTVAMLSHAGVTNRAISRITKHSDQKSLKHYETDSSESQKRMFSDILNDETESSDYLNDVHGSMSISRPAHFPVRRNRYVSEGVRTNPFTVTSQNVDTTAMCYQLPLSAILFLSRINKT